MTAQTILVVDDDPDVRDSLVDILEFDGYRVLTAVNGLDALRLLASEAPHPDLILLDILMPVMDGWTFLAEQQKRPELAAIPVAVVTAYAGTARPDGGYVRPAALLRKPIEADAILAAVQRFARETHAAHHPF